MGRSRRFPLLRTAATLAVLGTVAVDAGAAAGGTHHHCPPPGAHLIAHDRAIRVYSTGSATLGRPVEACLIGAGTRMTLLPRGGGGGGPAGQSLKVATFSGPLVAYLLTSFGVDSGSTRLAIADVASRRVLRELLVGHYVDAGFGGGEAVTKVVLGPRGAVAWIAGSHGPGNQTVTYAVHTARTVGPPKVLDEGTDIGATSLTLAGRTLSWSHGGVEHTAELP
jgi:hypothetical protein